MVSNKIRLISFTLFAARLILLTLFAAEDGVVLDSQQKRPGADCGSNH